MKDTQGVDAPGVLVDQGALIIERSNRGGHLPEQFGTLLHLCRDIAGNQRAKRKKQSSACSHVENRLAFDIFLGLVWHRRSASLDGSFVRIPGARLRRRYNQKHIGQHRGLAIACSGVVMADQIRLQAWVNRCRR